MFLTSSFLQIPPHGGHPYLRLYPSHYRADWGLAPFGNVRRQAHTQKGASVFQPMLPTFFFLHNKLYFYPSSSTIRTQPQAPVRPLHPPQSLPLPLVLNPLHLPLAKAQPRATKPGRTTLCGRLEQALRSDAYVGFREGQLTLVNHSRS